MILGLFRAQGLGVGVREFFVRCPCSLKLPQSAKARVGVKGGLRPSECANPQAGPVGTQAIWVFRVGCSSGECRTNDLLVCMLPCCLSIFVTL